MRFYIYVINHYTSIRKRYRRSAHLGGPNLTNSNKNVRSRLAAPMPSADGHAVRAELKQYTSNTRSGSRVTASVLLHVRSQNSKVDENGRYRKSEKVSDLRRADRGGERYGATAAFRSST